MSSSTGTTSTSCHWSQALTAAMNDPEQIVDSDDQIVIIKDKYPKLVNGHPAKESIQYEWLKLVCKQGRATIPMSSKGIQQSSKGIQPNQRSWKHDCGAVIRHSDVTGYQFVITKAILSHENHPTDHLALYHFLVLPRRNMPNLRYMTKNDLDLLKHMHNKGEAFANRANKELKFRFGYHAIPSLSHLHMHVISQDFNSVWLKTVKHYNSFNTKNFVDSADLIKEIETKGRFEIDQEEISLLLKKNLRCHVCNQSLSSLAKLKDHIVLHDVTRRENK